MPAFHDLLFVTTSVAPFLWVEEIVQLACSRTEVRAALLPFANRAAYNRERRDTAISVGSSDSCDDVDTQSSDFYRSGFTPTPPPDTPSPVSGLVAPPRTPSSEGGWVEEYYTDVD